MRPYCLVLSLLILPSIALSAIIHVPADQPTIQAGVDAAADGDTVLVARGIYRGSGNYNVSVTNPIAVIGEEGSEATIIDCQQQGRGFSLSIWGDEMINVSGFIRFCLSFFVD